MAGILVRMSVGTDDSSRTEVADDPLRLKHCPQCGYQLAGLPSEGTCPECGHAYDPRHVILHGWVRGSGATLLTGTWRDAGWIGVGVFTGLILAGLDALVRGRWTMFIVWTVLWGSLFAVLIWRRRHLPRPGVIELQIGPPGVRQVLLPDALSRTKYIPWDAVKRIDFSRVAAGRWRLRFRRGIPWWKPEVHPLDVEVCLPDELLAALRQRIDALRT